MTRDDADDRWRERPILGACLQALLTVTPLGVGIGVGVAVRSLLAGSIDGVVSGWVIAGVAAMITVWAMQPLVRRLVPLAWLLTLGMLWPGRAPSRFRVARSAGRIRDLEDRLQQAREHGIGGEAEEAAELILTLATALTAHDRKTRGHAERVRLFTDLLALEMGLPRHDRDRLRWAALLHDIGKLEVPERVLNKPGKPSPREWEVLKAHPAAGDRIMAPLRTWLGPWADTALHHHERWDGTGYPQGLAGEDISLGGRIVSVADAYDVMTAARSYKRPVSAASARKELVACSGAQFDPAVVRALLLVPTWRLRWALGPFAWVAQLPLAREAIHAGTSIGAVAPAAGAAAGATAVLVGSGLQPAGAIDARPDARDEVAAEVETEADEASAVGTRPSEVVNHTTPVAQLTPAPHSRAVAHDDVTPTLDPPRAAPSASEGSAADGSATPLADHGRDASDPADRLVDDATGTVGKVVEDTTSTVGRVVDDTTSTVGRVVDDTTSTVSGLVDDTASTVDEVVDDTTSTLGDVVNDPGGSVGEAVDGTKSSVGEVVDDTSSTVRRLLGRR